MGYLDDIVSALQKVPMNEAIPGGAGTTPTGDPTVLSTLLKNSITGPVDTVKSLVDTASVAPMNVPAADMTPEQQDAANRFINASWNTATSLAGRGMPAAEEGAAGILGGKLANTAPIRKLFEAQGAAEEGGLPDEIWQAHGWGRPPSDYQWRFEIPDNNLSLKYMPSTEGSTAHGSMESLVNHPQLFTAYPALKGISLSLTKDSSVPTGTGGFYNNHIDVNAPDVATARSVLAHELQHGVQRIEGFSYGAHPDYYMDLIAKGLENNPSLLQGNKAADVLNQAYPLYYKTAGEVESRNVQNRLNWPSWQRQAIGPWYSQDTPYSQQIIHDPITGTIKALQRK